MDRDYLRNLSFNSLKIIAEDMEISVPKNKNELIVSILDCFKRYEDYKKEKLDKYIKKEQLGNTGKEGVTYLVKTNGGRYFAMKTFKKTKSSERLKQEAELQQIASEFGIAPKVIDIDTVSKYIVMERMDKHLVDIMKEQNGDLTEEQQKQIIHIFKKLDEAKVFHGDSNILNYMYKKNKLYMIDFGMSKKIDDKLIKKLKTNTPNMTLMNLGFILKLKELDCPVTSYTYLMTFVSDKDKEDYRLV